MKGRKTGGRQKGTVNKVTQNMRAVAAQLLADYSDSGLMLEDWKELDPKDRMIIAEKLMQYTTPRLQAVAVSEKGEKHFTIEDKLVELSKEEEEL